MTARELAARRVDAVCHFEAAVAVLGDAYRALEATTQALEHESGQELARYLEVPIVLHLARAGLSVFLERKLAGTPASLRALVENQHRRLLAIEQVSE